MRIAENEKMCTGCGACWNLCERGAIATEWKDGFLYPVVKEDKCVHCRKCQKNCPANSSIWAGQDISVSAYAAYASDAYREKGSSGGIFGACAAHVLENGGAVYGAEYDEAVQVRHCAVECLQELERLYGSKYVQSDIGFVYREVKIRLKNHQKVLFSGTPCQIDALKKYLGGNDENLFCIDVICHGVPSPVLWRKYLEECIVGEAKEHELSQVNMRDKSNGWQNASFSFSFSFSDGKKMVIPQRKTLYMKCFASDIALRESCYFCKYRKKEHLHADLTLGDFWGIEDLYPWMNDKRGTSLVLVHSERGEEMLREADIKILKVDIEKALSRNPAALVRVRKSRHELKKYFMKLLLDDSIKSAYQKIRVKLFFTKANDKLRSLFKGT